ncbi:transcription factor [Roridomyces roridus]|uniref:Transcription factor n=1 Tax=Roridomyces roridus TaxID=1738132 RepID=A0AAD7FUA9_9AGAR|nr:transcription factor [Roridomyces roridus]
MPDNQIFKATYSGIPVYEMMCKGVAVMRRRSDSWLNATQILKVAGFDKPQRTRVLEREVQKGEHEKVQGGYGKYQGTWIPLERGLQLAKQYNCEVALRPIIEFQPAAKSPPLAPKHLVASSTASRPARKQASETLLASPMVSTRSSRRQAADAGDGESEHDTLSARGSEDGSMTPSPSEASSSSRTPSPIRSPAPYPSNGHGEEYSRRSKHSRRDQYADSYKANGANDPRAYADQLLEFFISDSNQRNSTLTWRLTTTVHTPLHWACAMGRIRVVKLLLTAGADIFKVNIAGQTCLMRSVMFANNYDVRKFPELYELLHRSTLNIDNYNRTLFHHIVDVAMSKGKTHASRYYMEIVLSRLSDYPKELADVINFQDEDGETALTMAARCRSKRLVKLLIDHGADPKVVNNDGKSTEDYILEDERFRSSPAPPARGMFMGYRNSYGSLPNYAYPSHGDRPPLHHSVVGQRASTRCVNDMTSMLDSLAASFDQELRDKERDTAQAHALLTNIQAEILESQRTVAQLRQKADGLDEAKRSLKEREDALHFKMGRRYRLGWEKWVQDEELRENGVRNTANGQLVPPTTYRPEDDMEMVDEAARLKRRLAQTEDISDLLTLYSDIPTDPEGLQQACSALRQEVEQFRKRRKGTFDELVSFQAEAGTSGRMGEYRRLIGAGCGGVPPSEVDHVLGMLLETLESEEPSSSSTAWAKPS